MAWELELWYDGIELTTIDVAELPEVDDSVTHPDVEYFYVVEYIEVDRENKTAIVDIEFMF